MGHTIIRPYGTRNSHPDEPDVSYDNDLCQAIRSGHHVYLRGQVGATFDGELDTPAGVLLVADAIAQNRAFAPQTRRDGSRAPGCAPTPANRK